MIKRFILLSYLVIACALTPAKAQNSFPYPTLPDTLRSVELRAAYLSEHYWDNFNFADTLELSNKEMAEQGFVNFIDILSRFNQQIAQKGIAAFTAKAFIQKPSKENSRLSLSIIMKIRNHPCAMTESTVSSWKT